MCQHVGFSLNKWLTNILEKMPCVDLSPGLKAWCLLGRHEPHLHRLTWQPSESILQRSKAVFFRVRSRQEKFQKLSCSAVLEMLNSISWNATYPVPKECLKHIHSCLETLLVGMSDLSESIFLQFSFGRTGRIEGH